MSLFYDCFYCVKFYKIKYILFTSSSLFLHLGKSTAVPSHLTGLYITIVSSPYFYFRWDESETMTSFSNFASLSLMSTFLMSLEAIWRRDLGSSLMELRPGKELNCILCFHWMRKSEVPPLWPPPLDFEKERWFEDYALEILFQSKSNWAR